MARSADLSDPPNRIGSIVSVIAHRRTLALLDAPSGIVVLTDDDQ